MGIGLSALPKFATGIALGPQRQSQRRRLGQRRIFVKDGKAPTTGNFA